MTKLKTVFDAGPQDVRPMTEDESRGLVGMLFSQANRPDCVCAAKQLKERAEGHFGVPFDQLPFGLKLLIARVAAMDPEGPYSLDMLTWVSFLGDRAGVLVLWAHGLVMQTRKHNGVAIDLDTWCQLHPMGPPTEEFMQALWDAQKDDKGGNRLDSPEAWA